MSVTATSDFFGHAMPRSIVEGKEANLHPVNRRGNLVLVASLQRVDDAQNLGGVATSGSRVAQDCADGLLGVDDEDGADGEGDALGVDVGRILVVEHVVGQRNLTLLVSDDGELERGVADLVDVVDPGAMAVDCVCGETDQLDAALGEFGFELGEGAEFGGADGGEAVGGSMVSMC